MVVIPEPTRKSLRSSPDVPAAKDSEGEALRLGVERPKPPPALTSGEYGLLVDGENDEM